MGATAALAAGARSGTVHFLRQGDGADVLLHHPQRIAQLVQLGFAFLVSIMREGVRIIALYASPAPINTAPKNRLHSTGCAERL